MGDDPAIRRRLRDLYELCLDSGKFVVITSPLRAIPEELSRQIALVELAAPDIEELIEFLRQEMPRFSSQSVTVDTSDLVLFAMARALQGLTLDESRHALRRALAVCGASGREFPASPARRKKADRQPDGADPIHCGIHPNRACGRA